jgi:BirA family transcriptional regulator, biotin operon repressor / biotin---[acetyl-CoA-carboxylase] ligase
MFKFYHFKTLNSTNDKAKDLVHQDCDNLVVIAEKQEEGRGRFGRKWNSGLGGLYMTIVLKEKNLEKVKYLTFIASISVAKTINNLTKLNALVKWPNDVLIDNKKICGILTETIATNYVLIGIGMNVNQKKFSKNLTKIATSLKINTNKNFNVKSISKILIKNFESLYKYNKHENYNKIIDIWKEYSYTLGKKIRAETLSGKYIGKAVGVDKDCNLILRLNNGKLKKIVEGDILVV